MRIHCLGAILSYGLTALAAPTPFTAAGSSPSIGSLGTLQVLKYNNLGPENNGTAAVLVYDRLDQSRAQAQCAAIGESLYPSEDDGLQPDLEYQLDYLVFSNTLQEDDILWIAQGSSTENCIAYSYGRKTLVPQPCHSQLPVICTANVPPTTDTNRVAVESSKISVSLDNHTLTGYRDARSFRSLRVPFADPPVEHLRFAPPQPYSGPKEIDATELADSCMQPQSMFGSLGNGKLSEDCLYLNVYTPILPSPKSSRNVTRKPVAVYFYGGSYLAGTISQIAYDGGFLTTGNLTTGSYAISDQILALKWMQKHIESFGGDPSRVTIFGESAGGQSVMALQSSPAARGLFSGAISQSALADLPWQTRDMHVKSIVPEVAKAVGCNGTQSEESLVSCLRSVPAISFAGDSSEFKSAVQAITQKVGANYPRAGAIVGSIEPFMPIVDDSGNGVIKDQFYRLLAQQGLTNRVPTMFTTTRDEASTFASMVPSMGSTQDALNKFLNSVFEPQLAKSLVSSGAYKNNNSDPDGARRAGLDALTHRTWSCAQAYLLRNGGQHAFPSLYALEISQGHALNNVGLPDMCAPNDNYNVTCHGSDILPIWGTLNSKSQNVHPYYDQTEILHSQILNDMFGSFFRTYNPNPDPDFLKIRGPAYAATYETFGRDQYQVPAYHPEAENMNLLGMPPSWKENPSVSEKCAVFDDFGYTFHYT